MPELKRSIVVIELSARVEANGALPEDKSQEPEKDEKKNNAEVYCEVVSTPAVYEAWSRLNRRKEPAGDHHGLLRPASGEAIMNMTFNDLEPAVFDVAPCVHRAFDAVNALGLGTFRVSGAGSTLYRLYDEEDAARHAAGIIEAESIGENTVVAAAPIGAGPIQIEE